MKYLVPLSNLVKDRVERARKAFDPREQGTELGTHIQVVGEDHGAGSVAKGESLAELAPLSTESGRILTSSLLPISQTEAIF